MLTMPMSQLTSSMANTPTLDRVTKDDVLESVCTPVGQAGVLYQAPYTAHDDV